MHRISAIDHANKELQRAPGAYSIASNGLPISRILLNYHEPGGERLDIYDSKNGGLRIQNLLNK